MEFAGITSITKPPKRKRISPNFLSECNSVIVNVSCCGCCWKTSHVIFRRSRSTDMFPIFYRARLKKTSFGVVDRRRKSSGSDTSSRWTYLRHALSSNPTYFPHRHVIFFALDILSLISYDFWSLWKNFMHKANRYRCIILCSLICQFPSSRLYHVFNKPS